MKEELKKSSATVLTCKKKKGVQMVTQMTMNCEWGLGNKGRIPCEREMEEKTSSNKGYLNIFLPGWQMVSD